MVDAAPFSQSITDALLPARVEAEVRKACAQGEAPRVNGMRVPRKRGPPGARTLSLTTRSIFFNLIIIISPRPQGLSPSALEEYLHALSSRLASTQVAAYTALADVVGGSEGEEGRD